MLTTAIDWDSPVIWIRAVKELLSAMAGPFPTPTSDWDCPDKAEPFKEFKQLSKMCFNVKGIKKEDQYTTA